MSRPDARAARVVRLVSGTLLSVLACAGLLEAVTSDLGTVLAIAMGGAVGTVLLVTLIEPGRRPAIRTLASRGGFVMLVVLAAMGAAAAVGLVGVLVVAAAVGAWLMTGRAGRGRAGGDRLWRGLIRQGGARSAPATPRDFLRALDDAALARLWTASRRAAPAELTVAETLRVAAVREYVLDELERRDPSGFQAWLDGGALTAWPEHLGRRG